MTSAQAQAKQAKRASGKSATQQRAAATAKKHPCLLLANDSVLITGKKLIDTFDHLEVAEFSAKSLIMAAPIGKLKPINDKEIEELRIAFHVGE